MLLTRLQDLISGIYDVSIAHDVYDFLVTDRGHLPAVARTGESDEELIVAQPTSENGGEVGMSLYLDPDLLKRLSLADPMVRLHDGNVADYWTALEGVSHFLYLAWNAGHDRPVSLLELEMQAEIDKYVASVALLRRTHPRRFPAELHTLLFRRTRVDPSLAGRHESLYRRASRLAARFCARLEPHVKEECRGRDGGWLRELRRFYRLGEAAKRRHIERQPSSVRLGVT
jgi:hypothetical protein